MSSYFPGLQTTWRRSMATHISASTIDSCQSPLCEDEILWRNSYQITRTHPYKHTHTLNIHSNSIKRYIYLSIDNILFFKTLICHVLNQWHSFTWQINILLFVFKHCNIYCKMYLFWSMCMSWYFRVLTKVFGAVVRGTTYFTCNTYFHWHYFISY